jgi:hypothetical protein
MNVRVQKSAQRARRPTGAVGDGPTADPDMAQMAVAEVTARMADHQVKVALAAYFIAERRGFEPGHELDDWLAAEAQIAAAGQPSVSKPIQVAKAESIS